MTEEEVLRDAFAMPLHNPAFPPGPYRFVDREYLIITYRTDPDRLQKMIPAPLRMTEPIVKYEFINMPDSTGFGHYCESGQVIPVTLDGVEGGYVHSMYLNDHPPIAAGRELWGFPKKLGEPELRVHKDTLIGTLDYSDFRVATGTMGFKHKTLDAAAVKKSMETPSFLLKVVPHVDGTPRICELVQYSLTDILIKGAWSGPGALELNPHALAPVAGLPVLEVLSAVHILADLTLPYGTIAYDYLAQPGARRK
ncbi:acetoacetate decarboxylase [Undibacterium sp.]|jgi:acetoacetate decarboxylase|uniref:acetoacetate decarboxylase n=1 Tax=Undibacterium sp. TaxID=1914977 RepID=UPI002B8E19D3|nr:acetoacetate decarboxylase [Undibacterium sp.]HTD03237.1 acetoacetate decarboxylase [Undibacterium sp.]